jgi:phosphatidylinositol alpha-1,6-mannosyltransferase
MVAAGMPRDRIRIVPPAIDPAELELPGNKQDGAGELDWPDAPTLLTVTRLVRRKGVDTVIEALPQIASAVPDIEYVVVGEGPEKERLRELSRRLGVESRVHFVGAVSDEQKAACLHLCDVFVMPSRDIPTEPPEGFGIVYLEANVCGKPVIAARTGGVEDAVEDGVNGLLVEPDSPSQVAEAVERLLRDPDTARSIGARGRARVLERFTWDAVGPRFVGAIRSLT